MSLKRILGSLFVGAVLSQAAQATPTLAEYAASPEYNAVDLSPNGSMLSIIHEIDGQDYLCVFNIAEQTEHCHANVRELRANGTGFIDDEHVLLIASERTRAFGSRGRFDQVSMFVVDTERGAVNPLARDVRGMHPRQAGMTGIIGIDEESEYVYVPSYNRTPPFRYDVFRVNLNTGSGRRVLLGDAETVGWVITRDGDAVSREKYDIESGNYSIETRRGDDWQTIFTSNEPLLEHQVRGLSPDRENLVVVLPTEDETADGIYYINLQTGEKTGPFFVEEGREIEAVYLNLDNEMTGIRYSGLRPAYHFFDEDLTTAMDSLMEQFQGTSVSYQSRSADGSRIVVYVSGRFFSGHYVVYDIASASIVLVVPERRWIQPEDMAVIETISYTTDDGYTIPSIVTWPRDTDMANLEPMPMIGMPHGGPEAYDKMQYDFLAQSIANQGYLVFQPNFRGSDGFGRAFTMAGRGEWGRAMQQDVTDGVNILIEEGWADPDRVCIVGWSYGGYAALAGGAFTPDLYNCVVAVAGVSDLHAMLRYEEDRYGVDSMPYRYWVDQFGRDGIEPEDLAPRSAAMHAEAFQAPVLLLHGEDDLIVPDEQSEIMAEALEAAGKYYEIRTFPGQNHSILDEGSREGVLQEIITFVNTHIGSN